MKKSELKQLIREEIRSTLNEGIGDKVLDKIFDFFKHDLYDDLKLSHDQALKLTDLIGDLIEKTLSNKINEQADHVAPMVVKAYKEYLKAKKEGGGEKEYRYYSKKLNNTYSTRADRDYIEGVLKKKFKI
jgi:hypothetical protein